MKILFLSPEVSPWSKTGGLADVAGALPRALAALGHQLMVVTPLHRSIDRATLHPLGKSVAFEIGAERLTMDLFEASGTGQGHRVIFLGNALFDRPEVYGDSADNYFRFAAYCEAALAVPKVLGFAPQVVHGNDWACGPAIWRAHERGLGKQVFTIHNLAYQGLFNASSLGALGWPGSLFHPEALEFYGQLSYMKAGLVFADAITTVSPTYAREIRTPELGCGLEGLLEKRRGELSGILNGIDDVVWNPRTDQFLPHRYGAGHMSGKAACKLALQRELGLPIAPKVPLFTMVSRFAEQKGFEILLGVLDDQLFGRAQVAILGNGDSLIEKRLLAIDRPQSFAVRVAFDDGLAHRLGAAGDFFLIPSRFEPCGLSQMYAMRYGTIPLVRSTGGLADTVSDLEAPDGTGIVFEPYTVAALRAAIDRAIVAFERNQLAPAQAVGMAKDFSWGRSAAEYAQLYERLAG